LIYFIDQALLRLLLKRAAENAKLFSQNISPTLPPEELSDGVL